MSMLNSLAAAAQGPGSLMLMSQQEEDRIIAMQAFNARRLRPSTESTDIEKLAEYFHKQGLSKEEIRKTCQKALFERLKHD